MFSSKFINCLGSGYGCIQISAYARVVMQRMLVGIYHGGILTYISNMGKYLSCRSMGNTVGACTRYTIITVTPIAI